MMTNPQVKLKPEQIKNESKRNPKRKRLNIKIKHFNG